MARNGSGVYSLPAGYLAITGQTIQAGQHNTPLEDLAADANIARPISVGGTGATTASGARINLDVVQNGAVGAQNVTPTNGAADTLANLLSEWPRPILLFVTGDSRAAGSNAAVGATGAAASNADCLFWKASTNQWVADTLGAEPFDASGNNNIARVIAHEWQRRTGQTIYTVLDATAGANIFQWLDPTAAHGEGSDVYWTDAEAEVEAALASSALTTAGVTAVTANIVALGANNGSAVPETFMGYMGNYVDQLRAEPWGASSAVLWLECIEAQGANSSNMNEAIRRFAQERRRGGFGVISARGLAGSDGVHETSVEMETYGPRAWAAWESRDVYVSTIGARGAQFRLIPSGTTSGAPYVVPSALDGMTWRNDTTADAWITLDPTDYTLGDTVTVQSRSAAGGRVIVGGGAGEIEFTDRPGFFGPSVTVQPGGSATWARGTDGSTPQWRLVTETQGAQPFVEAVGDGSTASAVAIGTAITGWTVGQRSGLNVVSGVVTITRPGVYQVTCSVGSDGEIRLMRTPSGGAAAVVLRTRPGANAQAHLTTALYCAAGDALRIETASAAGSDLDLNAQYTRLAIHRVAVAL